MSLTQRTGSAVQQAAEGRADRSVGWTIVGYSLLAILVYIAIADKPVVAAIGNASGLGSRIVTAWVKPVDPVSALTGSLALTGGAPSSSGATTAAAATGMGSSSAAPALSPPPSPSSIAHTPVARLPRRSNSPSTNKLWDELRARGIREGVLHA